MFITFCEVLSYVMLGLFIILLVGYWTGANYYFKLNKEWVQAVLMCNGIGWFFWLFVHGLGSISSSRTSEEIHNMSFGIVGIINIFIIGLFMSCYVYNWFEQSRKYFWSKRGR